MSTLNNASHAQRFSAWEPALWRVLGVLARRGYPVPPDEGRDLIHDFYLDAWDGLQLRFDERLSAFGTYVAAAFYRFARRRVVDLQASRARLVDLELALEHPSDAPTPDQVLESEQALARMREALQRLPARQRLLLIEFTTSQAGGERKLALRHGLTRHALRSELADSVSRLALDLNALQPTDAIEAQLANELWREGRSSRSAATKLNLTVLQVQKMRRAIAARLLSALRNADHVPHIALTRSRTMNDDLMLLRHALMSPGDEDVLRSVRQSASAIRVALSSDDIDHVLATSEFERAAGEAGWIGRVYAALSGEEDQSVAADNNLMQAMLKQRSDEQAEIGDAFASLLTSLGPSFHEWERWFHTARPVQGRVAEAIASAAQGAIRQGGSHATALLRWGVTPMSVQEALIAFEYLFDRTRRALLRPNEGRRVADWVREDRLEPGVLLEIDAGVRDVRVPTAALDIQISGVSNMPPTSVEPLRTWLFDVLVERPLLVPGHAYDAQSRRFARMQILSEEVGMPDDLTLRWCTPAYRGLRVSG